MKILILGGVGFLGTNMTIEAIKRGHKVIAFDNLSRNEVKNNLVFLEKTYKDEFQFVWGDMRKMDDFDKVPTVDAVINLAANPSVIKSIKYTRYDFETNAIGTLNSLEFAKRLHIPYIYASTNKVYSDITNELPIEEKEKRYVWKSGSLDATYVNGLDPNTNGEGHITLIKTPEAINERFPIDGFGRYGHSLYGISKASGELLVQEYGLQFKIPIVIFRMSCIYGLFQKGVVEQAWVDWFVRKIMLGDGKIEIFGTGKQVRDVLDGRDTARAYLDALENIDKVNHEIFTLGGGINNSYSLLETIEIIEQLTCKKAHIVYDEKRPADQDIYISSIKKIKDKLGWEPKIGLEQGVRDMIREYEK